MTKEVEIVNEDQFETLPEEAKDILVVLNEELRSTDIVKLNPIVNELIKINSFLEIKYDPEKPETIDQYKEAKKFIGHFNQKTKDTKKELKAPYLNVGRKLDAMEKFFLGAAKTAQTAIAKEFKPYLDEQARIKKEKEDKKNKELIDKANEADKFKDENTLLIARMNAEKKYRNFADEILIKTAEHCENYSELALEQEAETIKKMEFEIEEADREVLLPEQIDELCFHFNTVKKQSLYLITTRMKEINGESMKKVVEEDLDFVAPSISEENPEFFYHAVKNLFDDFVEEIKTLNPANEVEKKAKISMLRGIDAYKHKILNYLFEHENGEE